jgi:clathrin heavy chain
LSKQDKPYKNTMVTASVSGLTEVAKELLSYFIDISNRECFATVLYICFNLLRLDVMEELSWQHSLNDFYMLYKIQVGRSLVGRLTFLISLILASKFTQDWCYSNKAWVKLSGLLPHKIG